MKPLSSRVERPRVGGRGPAAGPGRKPPGVLPVAGFTLIELIGVLAVITILVAAIVPALIRQADQAAREQEADLLRQIAQAYETHVLKYHQVPTNWIPAVAAVWGKGTNDVSRNLRGNPRYLIVDPAFRVGATTNSVLPYVQTNRGSVKPVNPRLLFVSSLSDPLPRPMTNATYLTSPNTFEALWNATDERAPSGWTAGGRWEDIKMQRLNLDPAFVKLILNNVETPGGCYSVDFTNTWEQLPGATVLAPTNFTAYFIRGSRIYLRGSDGATIQSIEALGQDQSYVFEQGVWRGRLFSLLGYRKLTGADLQMALDLFMTAPNNTNAKPSGSPVTKVDVTNAIIAYLRAYTNWNNGLGSGTLTAVRNAQDTMAANNNVLHNFIYKAGH